MRVYEVQPGDSPASIAARPDMAGCPKCGVDLVHANPHKPAVVHPNGFTTFRELRAGEKLRLPDKWFSGELDRRPPAYFAALPYADGITPSTLGDAAAGVLGTFAALDVATAAVAALPALDDHSFNAAVGPASAQIDSSVSETFSGSNPTAATLAQQVRTATDWARQKNSDLSTALAAGDQAAATAARAEAQTALTTALAAAQVTLQVFYSGGSAPSDPAAGFPTAIAAAAQAVATAMAADPNYCTAVAQSGSVVNAAMHAFKAAWNAANPNAPVPINTGNYEQATADVLTRVLGTAPPACAARTTPSLPQPPVPFQPAPVEPPQKAEGLSTGAIATLTVLGAGAVGGLIYLATDKPTMPSPRRGRRSAFRYG